MYVFCTRLFRSRARSLRAASAFVVLAALTLWIGPARATEWEFSWRHPRPQGNGLGGAEFLDAQNGWAVGHRGTVVRTTDGGLSWSLLDLFPAFTADLEDLVVLGPDRLLAVGAAPGIFRSNDAGHSWQPVPNPSTARLVDVEIVSPQVLSAIGDNGQVLRSTDDGATWTLLSSPGGNLREQFWWSPTDGYVLGLSRVRHTTNGGQTWLTLTGLQDNDTFSEIFFTDPQHGFIFSDFELYRSSNGGASWTGGIPDQQFLYHGNAVVLSPTHFVAVTTVEGAFIFESTDAGVNWDPLLITGAGGFLDLDRLPNGTLVAVGSEGDIYRSTDDGQTWSNRTIGAEPARQVIGALAVGPSGIGSAGSTGTPGLQWYRTSDAGASWAIDQAGPDIAFTREIAYWDGSHAIAAGDLGQMWRSTDGGGTWSSAPLPNFPNNGRSWHVSLPAPGTAFAAVAGQTQSMIYRTTDYGASWHQRSTGIPANGGLTSVSFPTAQIGFACGYASSSPRMFKTTDAGGTWSPAGTTGLTNFPWDIHFQDALTGLATVYIAPGGIFRTTNGGTSWQNVWSSPSYDLAFSNGLLGGATPQQFLGAGEFYITEDGGSTWSAVQLPVESGGTAIYAVPDGFLVGGANGTIVSVSRADPTSVNDAPGSPDGAPNDLPNGGPEGSSALGDAGLILRPVRSIGARVEVSFELSQAGPAELCVYDVQGRRVTVLSQGDFAAATPVSAAWDGEHSDGRTAADGVYFIRLTAGRDNRAIKVVLAR